LFKRETTVQTVTEFASLLKPVPTKETLSKMARTDIEIERLKEEAQESGYAVGKEAGFPVGREAGYLVGYDEGIEKGTELKRLEIEALLARTVEKVDEAITRWFENAEPGLAQLSVIIAERIVAKELELGPEAILSMVKEAVAEVTHATRATIRVRIADKEILENRHGEILSAAPSIRELLIVDDPDLIGGCTIETDGGVVDATVDMKFNEFLEAIRRAA